MSKYQFVLIRTSNFGTKSMYVALSCGKKVLLYCYQFVSPKAIFGHIYESHVKMFFKCSICPKAFVEKADVYG